LDIILILICGGLVLVGTTVEGSVFIYKGIQSRRQAAESGGWASTRSAVLGITAGLIPPIVPVSIACALLFALWGELQARSG
jgi:hypothetical protein